ncbi:MAG: hypothetical protein WC477_06085 [Patescibacteria group bacterium]
MSITGGKVIARVFPRKTNQTPNDDLVFFTEPPTFMLPEFDEVHVSCCFTYDKPRAEWLAYQWESTGKPVKLGGPAYGDYTKEFIPGRYLKIGCTITSVGCPNHCWFCSVPKRAGSLKELDIKSGWIVQDDNLLACNEKHVRAVFEMLKQQKHRAEFIGGLEAKLLKPWHVELLKSINPRSMFFAYDTPNDFEPLIHAGKLFKEAEIYVGSRQLYCYVLIGYPNDTMENAETRLLNTLKTGFIPFPMLYKDDQGHENKEWAKFRRPWVRPAYIYARYKELFIRGGN